MSEVVKCHQARGRSPAGVLGESDLPPALIRRPEHLKHAQQRLDALIGLAEVRRMLHDVTSQLRRRALRGDLGRPSVPGMLLVGPSSTGKATVASLVGELLYGLGVLDNSRCVIITGSELTVAESGERPRRVHDVVATARGGVLLIDEAHDIGLDPSDERGKAVREQLLSAVLTPQNQGTLFILAGHDGPINDMMARDPWLQQRFPTTVTFNNLTPRQCTVLARRLLASGNYTCTEGFLKAFTALAREAIAAKGDGFGNARWAQGQVADAVIRMNARVVAMGAQLPDADRRRLIAADLVEAQRTYSARQDADGRDTSSSAADPSVSIRDRSMGDDPRPQLASHDEKMSHKTTAKTRMHASSAHMIVQRSGDHGTIAATGFAVTTDGLFVTNAHVVAFATSIEVIIGRKCVIATGTSKHMAPDGIDLALVEVSIPAGVHVEPLPLGASTDLEELTELLVLGHAQVQKGERPRMVKATVSRNDAENDQVHFEADGGIEEGFSGGPAVHLGSGAVVGVVSSGKGQTVKCIIRIEHVRSMLTALGYSFKQE